MKIKESLIRLKLHLDRARMWISIAQFPLMLWILLKQYHNTPVGKLIFTRPLISAPIIVVSFLIICIFVGYLDKLLGIRQSEYAEQMRQNPKSMEMIEKLDKIIEQTK